MWEITIMSTCPCGSGRTYDACCAIAHKSLANVKTAEQLMRSRYTAFTQANGKYLLESHYSSTRPITEIHEIVAWAKSVEWKQLEVIKTKEGQELDKEGTVKFKAHFIENGKADVIRENSKFVRENGCWVYLGYA